MPVSIGGLFPLTGDRCAEGVHALFGARMAVEATKKSSNIMADIMGETTTGGEQRKWSSWGDESRSKDGSEEQPFHLELTMHERDTMGKNSEALFAVDNLVHQGVDAFVGPLQSAVTEIVALLGKYDKIPVVSYYSPMAKLTSDATGLTTYMRTFPSDRTIIKASIDLINEFQWEGMTLITTNDEYGIDAAAEFNSYSAAAGAGQTDVDGARLREARMVYMDNDLKGIQGKLDQIKKQPWRIVVLHAPEELAAKILHVAKAMNMLQKGWVWIGTEWAADSLFGHCVWPDGDPGLTLEGDVAPLTCENMTGVEKRDGEDSMYPGEQRFGSMNLRGEAWDRGKVVCPFLSREAGTANYCMDGLSSDGTLSYMSHPEERRENEVPLEGLVAIRVPIAETPTALALSRLFPDYAADLLTEFGDGCPELEKENEQMHRLAYYAFDAVMAVAKGASDYYECGNMQDRTDTMCFKGTMRISRTWQGREIRTAAREELMDTTGGGRQFARGTSDMFQSVQNAAIEDSATGAIGFTKQSETQTTSGDPMATEMEIVNYVKGAGGTGEFVKVGTWRGSTKREEEENEELTGPDSVRQAMATDDCSGGHCGVLKLDRDDDDQYTITWFGGEENIPSDRLTKEHGAEARYMLVVLISLILAMWGGSILELIHFHYIPEAGFTCIIGMGVGIALKAWSAATGDYQYEEMAYFDEELFALVLLPIIIFDAGFGAKKARFFGNIGPILTTALFGTTISTFFVGTSIKLLGDWGLCDVQMGVFESLTFGALISAVDPVATLAVFGALKVETNLNYRVFGESIINDAVSIVLFRVFGTYMSKPWLGMASVAGAFKMFVTIGFGSVAMGMVLGFAASLVLKLSHIHDPLLAGGCFIISSYVAYEVTEAFHYSGIIASLFAGFCMRHYALINIADQYQTMVLDMVHMLASMSDLVIFFMVGENVILYTMREGVKVYFILWTILLCLLGRCLNIFPLCAIYNATKSVKTSTVTLVPYKDDPNSNPDRMILLSVDEQNQIAYEGLSEGKGAMVPAGVVINGTQVKTVDDEAMTPETISSIVGWVVTDSGGAPPPADSADLPQWRNFSKLFKDDAAEDEEQKISITFDPRVDFKNQVVMFHSGLRGAIAFALALGFPSQHRDDVIDTCNCVVLFTVFVLGGTTVPLLKGLGIPLGCGEDPEMLKLVDAKVKRRQANEGLIKKDLMYHFYVMEDKLKQFITRSPTDELGVFALRWEEMEEEQQAAAEVRRPAFSAFF